MIPENPYAGLKKEEKRVLIFTVSANDWEYVHHAHPYRGLQDKIMSNLFHQFVEKLKKYKIKHYEPENARLIASILRGDAVLPTDRD